MDIFKPLTETAKEELPILDSKDVGKVEELNLCYVLQREFRDYLMKHTKLGTMSKHERTAYYGLSMITEVCELLENVRGWKPHQSNPPMIGFENIKEEISDIFHYFLNFCIEWGMEPKDIALEFFKKQMTNRKRQHEGY